MVTALKCILRQKSSGETPPAAAQARSLSPAIPANGRFSLVARNPGACPTSRMRGSGASGSGSRAIGTDSRSFRYPSAWQRRQARMRRSSSISCVRRMRTVEDSSGTTALQFLGIDKASEQLKIDSVLRQVLFFRRFQNLGQIDQARVVHNEPKRLDPYHAFADVRMPVDT